MTTRRELPISGDSLGWVHNEVGELKSKVATAQQAAEQSRLQAMEATNAAQRLQEQMEGLRSDEGLQEQVQDAIITLHERLTRIEDDLQSFRHSRDEAERQALQNVESQRQERNEAVRAIGELDRKMNLVLHRVATEEDRGRRTLEASAQNGKRLETLENETADAETWRARTATTLGRIDEDLRRISSQLTQVTHETSEQRERTSTALENLRRVSAEVEGAHSFLSRIGEIDNRLELVQAERTRHNERINDLSQTLEEVEGEQSHQKERSTLIDARMAAYQDDMRRLRDEAQSSWDRLAMHLRGLTDLAADLRKRQINALEKEIRDLRGQSFEPGEG